MDLYLDPFWLFVLAGLAAVGLWPLFKILIYKLNVGADEFIAADARRREIKKTALVDIAIGRALQMNPAALRAYGRRNWKQLLSQESEIVSQVRAVLGDSEKVRFLQEAGELETICQPLFALRAAKRYSARDGQYRDRRRREIQKAELLALRKQLIEHFQLGTGSRRRGLLAGLNVDRLPTLSHDGRRS
jgi:hypothetical protein